MNAAEYLLNFFDERNTITAEQKGYEFPDIVAALAEVESAIDSWGAAGIDVHRMRDCLTRWKLSALNAFMSDDKLHWALKQSPFRTPSDRLSSGDLMGLETVAEKMSMTTVAYSDDARKQMSTVIDEAIKCIQEDDSLPQELILYIVRLINEARTALEEYEITGDFKLSVAFDRLSNALRVAEAKTKRPDIWQNFRDLFMIPLLAQVGVNAAVWGLTAAQVLPQIGS